MASLLIIFSLIYRSLFFFQFNVINLILILSLSIKLGIPPFHLWIISTSIFLNWNILFLLLSIQKIIPFYILSLIDIKSFILFFLIIRSSYVSTFKILSHLNFKIILTYSSINQSRWILLLITFKNTLWLIYFLTYSTILLIISLLLQFLKITYNFFYSLKSLNFQLIYIFIFFNIARLPPISFFFIKWFRVYTFILNSFNIIPLIIIILINSFILIYIYINIITLIIFFYSIKSKLLFISNFYPFKKLYLIIFTRFFLSLIIIMI